MQFSLWRSIAAVLLVVSLLAFDGPSQFVALSHRLPNSPQATAIEQLLRLLLMVILVAVVVAGIAALWRAAPGWHRRIGWIVATAVVLVTIVTLYFNATLRVYPSSERLRTNEQVPLTASPVTLREFVRGRRSVTWVSSDPNVITIDTTKPVPIATAHKPGRAVVFASRGTVRSQARMTVKGPDGSVLPEPCDTTRWQAPAGPPASTPAGEVGSVRDSTPDRGTAPPRPGPDSPLSGTPMRSTGGAHAATRDSATDRGTLRRYCIFGSVMSPGGQPLPHARVTLMSLSTGVSRDTLWTRDRLTEPSDGRYEFAVTASDGEIDTMLFRVAVSNHEIETKHTWFVPTLWGLDTASSPVYGRELAKAPNREQELDITLPYSTQSSFYLVWFLIPAVVGLLTTVYYRHVYGSPEEKNKTPDGKWDRMKFLTFGYVGGNALIWGVMIAVFAAAYAFRNIETIALFSPKLSIPVLAPAFAFLGVLVYATYSINRRFPFGLPAPATSDDTSQRALLAIGHRIIAAPYVALMGVLLVAEPGQSTWTIPLVSFFTGLWIEPILRLLRGVGRGLVAAQRTSPKKPVAGVDAFERAKLAVDQQRPTLLALNSTGITVVDVNVGVSFGGNGNGAVPVARVRVKAAPPSTEDDVRKVIPDKIEGRLQDGTTFSVATELDIQR